jgi:monoamine oxidase
MATRDQSTVFRRWLRDHVRASRAATTLESWRATKPTTTGIVQCKEPDGPFYFAGEHLSHIGAWKEGAILSARRA